MVQIKELDKEKWKNYKLYFSYYTDGYYSFEVEKWDFKLVFNQYDTIIKKSFTDYLFNEWVENPIAFGAFINEQLVGVIECSLEKWNNRFRITNLLVFENFRTKGIGKVLINKSINVGINVGARMIILETQTCNHNAIDFYCKVGFEPIGFDLYSYTNNDIDKSEVRLEMGKILS